jgi:hypothetical protein
VLTVKERLDVVKVIFSRIEPEWKTKPLEMDDQEQDEAAEELLDNLKGLTNEELAVVCRP